MANKTSKAEPEYSSLPLLSRRALCTHYSAMLDRLSEIEDSFMTVGHHRIETCPDDNSRAAAFWEYFDIVVATVSELLRDTLKAYREILIAHIEGSPLFGESEVQQLIAAFEATGNEIIKHTISRIPRWLKYACDGEPYTQEDIRFIDARRKEYSVHNPGRVEDFRLSFEICCEHCGERVRKLASHVGGAEFDIPSPSSDNWVRHKCYSDISRIMRELLGQWVVPSWFINPEFAGRTVDVPYRRLDNATGKVQELEPIRTPVAEEVTRVVRSDMEGDVRLRMQAVSERENQHFIHQSALALAKRVSLRPVTLTAAGYITVPLPHPEGAQSASEETRVSGESGSQRQATQRDMTITKKTYFVTEAESLIHSQDRPGELVAAYSTEDPYFRDTTLLCFSDSSIDLLEKLKKVQANHQKLLIHWGESEEELEELPDVLRAYLSLKETAKTVHGKDIDYALQNLRSFFESDRKKRGRPRQDALSERVNELRKNGRSWGEIQRLLNKETGVERTTNAYRNLLRSRLKSDVP